MSGKVVTKTTTKKPTRNVNKRAVSESPRTTVKEVITFAPKKPGGRDRGSVSTNVSNPYARVLLNPEFEENVGVPDWFDQPTHKWVSILNVDVPVSASGKFQIVIQPDLEDFLYMAYRATNVVAELMNAVSPSGAFGGYGVQTAFLDHRGKFLFSSNALNAFNTSPLSSNTVLWSASRSDPCAPGSEHSILMPTTIAGLSGVIPASGLGFVCDYQTVFATGTGASLVIEGIDSNGTALTSVAVALTGAAGMAISPAFAGSDAWITRISLTQGPVTGVYLRSVRLTAVSNAAPVANLQDYYLTSQSVQDYDTYESDFVAVRPVGCSGLLTYRGKALEGGFVAARRFQSEQTPSYSRAPVLPYSVLASRPGTYDGVVNTGAYSFWLPNDFDSFKFRPVSTSSDSFTDGYMVYAGTLTDPSQSALRIRAALAMEGITYKQMYHLSPCLVDDDMVSRALRTLSSVPSAMENDLHWSTIAGYLKKGASAIGRQLWDNKAEIANAAGKAAGLSPGVQGAISRLVSAM